MAVRELTEHPLGLTWVVDDPLLRASHALVARRPRLARGPVRRAERRWSARAALGELAGVLQLFVAHERDGEAIAQRLGVAVPCRCPRWSRTRRSAVLNLDSAGLEGTRAVVAGAQGPGRRRVGRHRDALRGRQRPGRRAHAAPAAAAQHA